MDMVFLMLDDIIIHQLCVILLLAVFLMLDDIIINQLCVILSFNQRVYPISSPLLLDISL